MYLVIEIQTNADRTVGNLVYKYDNEKQAQSKFHTVLAAAVLSQLPVYTCVLMTNTGTILQSQCYINQ